MAGPTRRPRTALARAVRASGRSYVWLAKRSGITDRHIRRVASGQHSGTLAFHRLMQSILEVDYPLPRKLRHKIEEVSA